MSSKDSVQKTILVAFAVCLVCSVIVSSAAVMLAPIQDRNKALDVQKNILMAAGLYTTDDAIASTFEAKITARLLEFATGEYVEGDPSEFDRRKAEKDPASHRALEGSEDIASVRRLTHLTVIYEVRDGGQLTQVVLPVHGYGLWSTLYGFLAVQADGNTIQGLGYYQHGETPGLGGEVDNPRWKALWKGKHIHDAAGNFAIKVMKGAADPKSIHQVDGLAGATITANGVNNMLRFWLGDLGYGKFLAKLAKQQAQG